MINTIFKRRSIRRYTNQKIDNEQIELIVKAGMNAPSANNIKLTYFIIIDDKNLLLWLSKTSEHKQMLKDASHAIIVCAKEESPYWVEDAAAATENILLAATSLNIGSCWLGLYPNENEKDIKSYLNIPNDIHAISIVSLGFPAEEKEPNNYFIKEKIHYNEWR